MKIEELKENSLLKSSYWPEPVIVKSFKITENSVEFIIEYPTSKKYDNPVIPKEEWDKIEVLNESQYFNNDPRSVFLALETLRYRYASLYDPLLAINISKVDPLPHQIEAVYGYVLKLPRIRFLIADDPGAGKTIMAGLIIKELKLRNVIKNILIVTPGHLKNQWARELKEKFEENFIVVNREVINSSFYENIWEKENQIICSMDFIKQDDIKQSLLNCYFDLVIVDEAHKMSAYRYGEKITKTNRYELGELLSNLSNHLLFLTATPHKGDPENFRLFLDLLDKGFFATKKMIEDSITNKDNPLFIRRIKEDLKDFDGKPLFLPRNVKTITFNYGKDSPLEKELYNELSKYIENQYNLATKKEKSRNIVFALVILQRRFASSVYSLLCSLKRRKKKLEELLSTLSSQNDKKEISDFSMEDIEDSEENERWEIEEKLETLSGATSKEELKEEIKILENLIKKAEKIIQGNHEIKLKELKKSLDELSSKVEEGNKRKILIFTESKDTLDYLEEKISQWGYKVNSIHGKMKLDERIEAEARFRNETDILVATEAAGEGINLQFCNLMINYDIPWNPNRLEQRMGRIHRYGQKREVFIHNFVAEDTREGMVLNRLFQKIEQIKSHLGNDKVFDVLGDLINNKDFSQVLIDASVNARTIEDIIREIDNNIKIDQEYINKIKEALGESLATHYINYTLINEMAQKAKEFRLIPEYTQNFFLKAMEKLKGKLRISDNKKEIAIEHIPYEIKKIANENEFKKKYGPLLEKYPKVTFDKQYYIKNNVNEFISFGHPLFEAILSYIEKNFLPYISTGALFYDPDRKLDGYILYYESEIKDGNGNIVGKKLFSYYLEKNNIDNIRPVTPSIIWDLAEAEKVEQENLDKEKLINKVYPKVLEDLKKYKQEIFLERKKQCEIKEKYGKKSLEYIICKLDKDLIDLQERLEKGEDVNLVIRNKKSRKEDYEQSLKKLEKLIVAEQSLSMNSPRFLGIIRIKPMIGKTEEMKNNEEIEKIGMKIAIEYETKNRRIPKDVSLENLGFDIRSKDINGKIRYIEVKARSDKGDITLTPNEWFKAIRFGEDYYLYVIYSAATNPELHIIQNPAENLNFGAQISQIRYIVNKDEITQKGIKDE